MSVCNPPESIYCGKPDCPTCGEPSFQLLLKEQRERWGTNEALRAERDAAVAERDRLRRQALVISQTLADFGSQAMPIESAVLALGQRAEQAEAAGATLRGQVEAVTSFVHDWCEDIDKREVIDAVIHIQNLLSPAARPDRRTDAMTTDDLDTLTATVGRMTPGPWTVSDDREDGEVWVRFPNGLDSTMLAQEDAEGIVALRNAAPALLQDARTLAEVRAFREAIRLAAFDMPIGWRKDDMYRVLALLDAAPAQEDK